MYYKGKLVKERNYGLISYYEELLDRMAYSHKVWLYQHLDGIREDVELYLDKLEYMCDLYERGD